MPIEKRFLFSTVSLGLIFLGALSLRAATIEVENDDEEIEAAPTATAVSSKLAPSKPASEAKTSPAPAAVKPAPAAQATPVSAPNGQANASIPVSTRRVRISDNVGFYYFLKAGYVTDPDKIPAIGQVVGSADYNQSYSVPKKTFVETDPDKAKLAPGDLLVVYRAVQPVEEAHSGSLGFQVENEAIIRVMETQENRYLVETVKSFWPFREGDKIVPYETEIQRWKAAQIKKPLPAQTLACFVAGGSEYGVQKAYNQQDCIYLSAGTKQGVVEGQNFRLWKITDTGVMSEDLRLPVGEAQVLFAGPDCSTARILRNSEPIEKGFKAEYKP